jgi:hypothetical protein
MSEQQVRLSDKQAMACAKLRNFRPYRGGDWSAFGVLLWKEKKVKKSFMHKTTKRLKD